MKALVLVGCVVMLGCGDLDSGLPPVGTTWQECGDNGCVTHVIGNVYACTITGSPWEEVDPSALEGIDRVCWLPVEDEDPEDPTYLEEDTEEWACDPAPENVCAYECGRTDERCDMSAR